MSPRAVQRTMNRLAYEVIERNRGIESVRIFGILDRGAVLASSLAACINSAEGADVPVTTLDVTPFRDDLPSDEKMGDRTGEQIDVTDKDVILVDDVLFTGRTVRAALDAIISHGRPRSIQLAVLIDRGHREYPVQPDYFGRKIPTKYGERVVVSVDGPAAVFLEE
jgi:pyrimidine operon attenuation protein / uracil phosphoribosyltransferase